MSECQHCESCYMRGATDERDEILKMLATIIESAKSLPAPASFISGIETAAITIKSRPDFDEA